MMPDAPDCGQDLAARHEAAAAALEEEAENAMRALLQACSQRRDMLQMDQEAEFTKLHLRQAAEMDRLRRQCAGEGVRHHASKQLLELRSKECHLRRQCCFEHADKVKSRADALEAQEIKDAAEALADSQGSVLQQLLMRHDKELSALQHKARKMRNDVERSQGKEVDMLRKRYQVRVHCVVYKLMGLPCVALQRPDNTPLEPSFAQHAGVQVGASPYPSSRAADA
jgi:hypothetical protein